MTTIYHNPRCSKSRQTLALLEEHDIDFNVVEYLNNTPGQKEIKRILKKLNKTAQEIIRKNEKILKEKDIDIKQLPESKLIALMAAHPILIERPIVETEDSARIGRPPASVLELFEK